LVGKCGALVLLFLLVLHSPLAIDQQPPEPSRGGDRIIKMEATAYCYTGLQTKTGTWPKEGRTVAVDPAVIPYGTRLIINGKPGYIAEDCGGAIKGNKIDIYMTDYERCIQFGRRTVEVKIMK